DDSPLSSYTYLYIKARVSLDGKDGEIYFDLKVSRLYIDKSLLISIPNYKVVNRAEGVRGLYKLYVKLL
ncbi:hypothetical protein QBC39DRAFT_253345, partial [Podospora conica]